MRRVGLCACLAASMISMSAHADTSDDVSLHGQAPQGLEPAPAPVSAASVASAQLQEGHGRFETLSSAAAKRARFSFSSRPGLPADFTAKYLPGSQRRWIGDLQLTFDRVADNFYQLYKRARQKNGDWEDPISVALAIRPDGRVAEAEVVSSKGSPVTSSIWQST